MISFSCSLNILKSAIFTFTFRALSRRFYPKRLAIFPSDVCQKKEKQYIAVVTIRMFI